MKKTSDLLARYKGERSDDLVAAELGVDRTTIVMARKAGRLSPHLAMQVAEALHEPVAPWMAVAAAEAEREPKRSQMLQKVAYLFGLGVVGLGMLATPYSADANQVRAEAAPVCVMLTVEEIIVVIFADTKCSAQIGRLPPSTAPARTAI